MPRCCLCPGLYGSLGNRTVAGSDSSDISSASFGIQFFIVESTVGFTIFPYIVALVHKKNVCGPLLGGLTATIATAKIGPGFESPKPGYNFI